ncbi:MAG: hypothetical protein RLY31_508 [Bacteroidota bacterium]|jgi:hypothetical protein
MKNPLDDIEETFEIDLPHRESLDDYLDAVLPDILHLGEDLREQHFYVLPGGKPWLEIRDDPGFQESVLHFFNEDGEYLQSVDGNVSKGRWRLLDGTNKIIIEQGGNAGPGRSELFELAFLNARFFILRKHGNLHKQGRRYFFMGFEPIVSTLKWKDCVDLLYNEYRNKWGVFQYFLVVAILIVAAVALFSVF